jgi:ribosomal protein L37AE/L43A
MKIFERPEVLMHTCAHIGHFPIPRRERARQEANPTEKRFLKALHWMRCPKCGHELTAERHSSVEIEVCPECRGIWLDPAALEAVAADENDFLRSCLRNLLRHRHP